MLTPKYLLSYFYFLNLSSIQVLTFIPFFSVETFGEIISCFFFIDPIILSFFCIRQLFFKKKEQKCVAHAFVVIVTIVVMISDIIEEETFNGKEVSNESIKRSCTEPNCEE